MSAPDTSPEAVERLAKEEEENGHFADAALIRALSSQLQEAQREIASLRGELTREQAEADGARTEWRDAELALREAHRHLGTALEDDDGHGFDSSSVCSGWCRQCQRSVEEHTELAAARAYYRAHGGQG